jgi:membrane complex biogenesis BtpA family protein
MKNFFGKRYRVCSRDMTIKLLDPNWSNIAKPVIGMLHLPALPGAPQNRLNLGEIRDAMLRDADALAHGGVHGLMMENFGDVPFYPARVPGHVVAQMTMLAAEVRRAHPQLPLGINVLRNDGQSALAIAHAVGASFIRVNVLCGARVADQGLIQGIAHDLLRERAILGATDVKIFADVDVKHSAALAQRPLADEVDDLIERALADAIVVSGAGTGKATDAEKVRAVKQAARDTPVFVGSGITAQTIEQFLPHADGFIVGTALKKDGVASNPVDIARVEELLAHGK